MASALAVPVGRRRRAAEDRIVGNARHRVTAGNVPSHAGMGPASIRGRHVVFFNWRDTANPEGGGSERYVETMARGLVGHGARVTIFCAAHEAAPSDEMVDGVRYVRRGNQLDVYLLGVWSLLRRRFGKVDVVVDVQNGLPFFTRLAHPQAGRGARPPRPPGAVAGRLPGHCSARSAGGSSAGSPRCSTAAASTSRSPGRPAPSSMQLGVDKERIAVVHNGTAPGRPAVAARQDAAPALVVVGRLVPHKQIEHADRRRRRAP